MDNSPKQELICPVDPRSINLPVAPVQDATQVEGAIWDANQAGVNVLSANMAITFIPPNYAIALRLVQFSTGGEWDRKSNGVWYREGGGLVLHKAPLRHLASMAGISWRVDWDSGLPQFHWRCTALGRVRSLDGTWRQISGSKEVDLTDGGAELQKMERDAGKKDRDPMDQISGARKFGQRMCEEKAVNAMIRGALGLKMKFSEREAEAPFCLPVLIYIAPDTPEVQAMQAAAEFGIADQVYGQKPEPVAAEVIDVEHTSAPVEPAQEEEAKQRQIPQDPLHGQDPLKGVDPRTDQREKAPAQQQGGRGGGYKR